MDNENNIIVAEVRNGVLVPHIACADLVSAMEGTQIAITVMKMSAKKIRSAKMNNCVHLFCKIIADEFNARGIDQVVGIVSQDGNHIEMRRPFSGKTVKIDIFQEQLLGVTCGRTRHTSKASNAELCETEEIIGRMLAENFDIVVQWPSNQPPAWRSVEAP